MKSSRPIRRLGLSDAMILIAASGAGLAVFQLVSKGVLGGPYQWSRLIVRPLGGWTPGQALVRLVELLGPSLPFAAAWTCVIPLLRLRAPRPSIRRVLRQPGTVACLASIIGALWATTALLETLGVLVVTRGRQIGDGWLFHFVVEEIFPDMGLAVAAAWFGQAIAGRWRPVPDWVDRLGRVLGCYWIIVGSLWATRRYLDVVNY
jgi:hypothetical protein